MGGECHVRKFDQEVLDGVRRRASNAEYHLLPFCSSNVDDKSQSTLMAYKERLELKIGLYVQEFNIDEAALNLLVHLANENPNLLENGITWGGLNGVTVRGIQPGRFTCTDGFHTQRYAGRSWNSSMTAASVVVSDGQ
ncbi:hypothetical protein MHU86_24416 [Fragilaria crotonensis]|nr:hypothetical protein MHU86_24416 [Fragilaria crotonensis]